MAIRLLISTALAAITAAGVTWAEEKSQKSSDKQPPKPLPGATTEVVADGVGATANDALKDAFRNAVRQVVGAVVDAETLVKNDELISDKVLTYSRGFIKTYKEISTENNNGIFRTKIRAIVIRTNVIAKLKAANVTTKEIDGKGKYAQVVTQLESEKNANEMLIKDLEGFPINVLEAVPVGEPEVVEKSESGVKMAFRIQFKANIKAYDRFVIAFHETLKRIAVHKGVIALEPGLPLPVLNLTPDGNVQAVQRGKAVRTSYADRNVQAKFFLVMLNTKRSGTGHSSWAYYVLNAAHKNPFDDCYSHRLPALKIQLLDREGQPLPGLAETCEFDPKLLSHRDNGRAKRLTLTLPNHQENYRCRMSLIHLANSGSPKGAYVICPFFKQEGTGTFKVAPVVELKRHVSLKLDELQSLGKLKCELGVSQ